MSDLEYGVSFSGHDWENLNRLVAQCRFKFLVDGDFSQDGPNNSRVPNHPARCAHLASQFRGPALDWIASTFGANIAIFNDFDGLVTAVRQGFGVADDNIKALCQTKLDELHWGSEIPVFFAELDRLFLALGISGHQPRLAHVYAKLPSSIKMELASQGRQFHNYETMREHLNTRWALMPRSANSHKTTKCGNCGKKGHDASVCRKSKN